MGERNHQSTTRYHVPYLKQNPGLSSHRVADHLKERRPRLGRRHDEHVAAPGSPGGRSAARRLREGRMGKGLRTCAEPIAQAVHRLGRQAAAQMAAGFGGRWGRSLEKMAFAAGDSLSVRSPPSKALPCRRGISS